MWNFSCKEQVFTAHIPPFSSTTVSCCPAGEMGSHLALLGIFVLGMLLPLADSSLLNSAHLVLKTQSLGSGLATEGTELLCSSHPGLGVGSVLCTPRESNDGCRERDEFVFPKRRFPAVLSLWVSPWMCKVKICGTWTCTDKICEENQAVQEPELSLPRQTGQVGK